MVEQIEGLEHHAHLLTDLIDIAFFVGDTFTVYENATRCRGFKHIDATDKG